MPLQPIYMQPGICKSTTDYSAGKTFAFGEGRIASGRFVDGDHIRFVAGFPEKIGGNVQLSGGMAGIPRALQEWRDNAGNPRIAIGTETHLYYWDGTNLVDITPIRTISTGSLSNNPLTTTNGSASVAVSDSSNHVENGDYVLIQAASVIGGLTVNGWYPVSGRTSAGYNITVPVAATSSVSGGGGATTFGYPRKQLSAPFATTNGSVTVTVTDTAHGATTGDYVDFDGFSAVGGLTISGEYQLTVVDGNTYTIQAASAATSTATGGGAGNVTYDISMQQLAPASGEGYGSGAYGVGYYGQSGFVTPLFTNGWTLAPYGNQILAAPIGGTIYVYNPVTGGRAYPLLNAPSTVAAIFVTPERFVIALGINGNLLEIAWADQSDYTDWTTSATNTANSGRTLQGGSYLVGGIAVAYGTSLIFSDKAVFQLSYTGDNTIYSSPFVAQNAGLVDPLAVVVYDGVAYWMSQNEFYMWNGSVQPLPSDDIRDYVFRDINPLYVSKCSAGLHEGKKEVWFFYPSSQSTEVDRYVIYHTDQQCFSIGSITRTAWIGESLFPYPIATDASGNLYQHEIGTDDNGAALDSYITFAPIDVSNGTNNVDVMGFIPDFERLAGSANLIVNTRYYPQDANTASGPFTITDTDSAPRIDLRADGKMVGFEIQSNEIGGDFRLALVRLDLQQAGARR